MHIACFAADESFIDLDFAAELAAVLFILHGEPATLQHEPSGFLGDAHGAVDFP